MDVEKLPLFDLFARLRRAEVPLGIEEYQLLLRSLQGGFGIEDRAALKRLCRTLWVKSADDERLFHYYFEQMIPWSAGSESPAQPPEPPSGSRESPPKASPETGRDGSPPEPSRALTTIPGAQMAIKADDEVRVAQAVLQNTRPVEELPARALLSSDEYFPVTRRQMKQSWRYLRRMAREGPPVELDVKATIDEFSRRGTLLEPVLVPSRVNRAELLLLIDYGGSMIPFHMLASRLVETALRGGRLGKADMYYFHNCPAEYLYDDPDQQEYVRIDDLLKRFSERTGILIFSDAGAARGGFNKARVELTAIFLAQLKQQFSSTAWLNPMPRSRWPGTTAGEIMRGVSMFELSRKGLDNAIRVLRGRSAYLQRGARYE